MWRNGVVLCINAEGQWNLTYAGPPLQDEGAKPPDNIISGTGTSPGVGKWHTLGLTVEKDVASASLDGSILLPSVKIRDMDTGFGAIGSNGWFPIEYRNLTINQTKGGWEPPAGCEKPASGS